MAYIRPQFNQINELLGGKKRAQATDLPQAENIQGQQAQASDLNNGQRQLELNKDATVESIEGQSVKQLDAIKAKNDAAFTDVAGKNKVAAFQAPADITSENISALEAIRDSNKQYADFQAEKTTDRQVLNPEAKRLALTKLAGSQGNGMLNSAIAARSGQYERESIDAQNKLIAHDSDVESKNALFASDLASQKGLEAANKTGLTAYAQSQNSGFTQGIEQRADARQSKILSDAAAAEQAFWNQDLRNDPELRAALFKRASLDQGVGSINFEEGTVDGRQSINRNNVLLTNGVLSQVPTKTATGFSEMTPQEAEKFALLRRLLQSNQEQPGIRNNIETTDLTQLRSRLLAGK